MLIALVVLLNIAAAVPAPEVEISLKLIPVTDSPQAPHTTMLQPVVTYRNRSSAPIKLLLAYGCDQRGFHSLIVDGNPSNLTEHFPACKDWFARGKDRILAAAESITIEHPVFTQYMGTHRFSVRYEVPAKVECPDCRKSIDACGKLCNAKIWRGAIETPPVELTLQ